MKNKRSIVLLGLKAVYVWLGIIKAKLTLQVYNLEIFIEVYTGLKRPSRHDEIWVRDWREALRTTHYVLPYFIPPDGEGRSVRIHNREWYSNRTGAHSGYILRREDEYYTVYRGRDKLQIADLHENQIQTVLTNYEIADSEWSVLLPKKRGNKQS